MMAHLFRSALVRAVGCLSNRVRDTNQVVAKQYERDGRRRLYSGLLLLSGFIAVPIVVAIILVLLTGVRL